MAEETATTAVTTKKQASKKKMPSKWMIGLILLVLVLGGLSVYQFKKNKDLKQQLEQLKKQKPASKDNAIQGNSNQSTQVVNGPSDGSELAGETGEK